jgi:hypothetical protein
MPPLTASFCRRAEPVLLDAPEDLGPGLVPPLAAVTTLLLLLAAVGTLLPTPSRPLLLPLAPIKPNRYAESSCTLTRPRPLLLMVMYFDRKVSKVPSPARILAGIRRWSAQCAVR